MIINLIKYITLFLCLSPCLCWGLSRRKIVDGILVVDNSKLLNLLNLDGIALWPCVFVREGIMLKRGNSILTHEAIHLCQQREMLIIGFYVWYLLELIIRKAILKQGYNQIWFEKEAYENEENKNYLKSRQNYASFKYKKYIFIIK